MKEGVYRKGHNRGYFLHVHNGSDMQKKVSSALVDPKTNTSGDGVTHVDIEGDNIAILSTAGTAVKVLTPEKHKDELYAINYMMITVNTH